MEEKIIMMQTQINGFPELKHCELMMFGQWRLLIDKRDWTVIYLPTILCRTRKQAYDELCFLIDSNMEFQKYVPLNVHYPFKEFEKVRYLLL